MADRRCCCFCPEKSDNFQRSNSEDLGPLWYPSDDARIVDWTMEIDEGMVVFRTPIWDSQGSFLASITIDDPVDDSDVYDVVLVKKESDDSFTEKYRIRFDPDTTSGWWTTGFKEAGEANFYKDDEELITGCGTYQMEFLAGRTFNLSYDREVIRVGGLTPTFPHYEFWRCMENADWTHIALSHGEGPRPVRFDVFHIIDHWVHDRRCPFWGCVCGGEPE